MSAVARVHDVEHCADPFCLIVCARSIFDSLRVLLVDADDNRGGWTRALEGDPERRRIVLDSLAYAGEHLARLTVVVDETTALREAVDAEVAAALEDVRRRREASGEVCSPVAGLPGPADVVPEGAPST